MRTGQTDGQEDGQTDRHRAQGTTIPHSLNWPRVHPWLHNFLILQQPSRASFLGNFSDTHYIVIMENTAHQYSTR